MNVAKLTCQVILVVFADVALCLCLQPQVLLELFLVFMGALIIAEVSIFVARTASELMDLMHAHKCAHELRELKLQRIKQQPFLPHSKCRLLTNRRLSHR